MGRRTALHCRFLLPVLLDAARLDHTCVGAGGRPSRSSRIWTAQLLDEQLLGRGSLRDWRMPCVRSAAQTPRVGTHSRRGPLGAWSRPAVAYATLRVHLSACERCGVYAVVLPQARQAGAG